MSALRVGGTADPAGSFVVRRHSPVRARVLLGASVLCAVLALYGAYEIGRRHAGYDRLAAAAERSRYEQRIRDLEREERDLREQAAAFDTLRAGQARERAEVARQIADLKAQLDRDAQDLAVYRGVVAPHQAGQWAAVEELRISSGGAPGQFHVHLHLVQAGRPDAAVSGSLDLSVAGRSDGADASLPLAQLTAQQEQSVPFTLHYYLAVDRDLQLPAGFQPQTLNLQLHSSRKADEPLAVSFPWRVDAP